MEPLSPPAAHPGGASQVQNSTSGQNSHPASKLPLQWALSDEEKQFCTDVLGGGLISRDELEMICGLVSVGPWGILSRDDFLVVKDVIQRRLQNAIKPGHSSPEPSQPYPSKTTPQADSRVLSKPEEGPNEVIDRRAAQEIVARRPTLPDADQPCSLCQSETGMANSELARVDEEVHSLVDALHLDFTALPLPTTPPQHHVTPPTHNIVKQPPLRLPTRRPPSDPLSAEHLHVMLERELAILLHRAEELSDKLAGLPSLTLELSLVQPEADALGDAGGFDYERQVIKDELVSLVVDKIPELKRQIQRQSQTWKDEEAPLPLQSQSVIATSSAVKSSNRRPPSLPPAPGVAGSRPGSSKSAGESVVNMRNVPNGGALEGNDGQSVTVSVACSTHLDIGGSQAVSTSSYPPQPSSAPSVPLQGISTLRSSSQSYVIRAAALEEEMRTDIFMSRRGALNLGRFFEDGNGNHDTRCTPAAADGGRDPEDGGRTPTQSRCSLLPSPPLQVAQESRAATASSTTSCSPLGSSRSLLLQEILAGKALLPATVGQRSSNIPLGKVLQDDYGTLTTQSPIECEPISGLELVLGPRISLSYPQPPARLLLNSSPVTRHTEEVSMTKENSEGGTSQTLLDNQSSAGRQDGTLSHSSSSDDVLLPVGDGDEEDEYVMV